MKASIRQKLEKSEQRFEELGHLLADPQLGSQPSRFRELSVEYARLQPTAVAFAAYRRLEQELSYAQQMLDDADAEIRALGEEEMASVHRHLEQRGTELQKLLNFCRTHKGKVHFVVVYNLRASRARSTITSPCARS